MQEKRTMEQTMLVRLKAHEPKKGLVLKQYTYRGVRFQAGRGWYKVNGEFAAYLASVHSVPGDQDTPLAFDVRTPDEARAMDENDRKAARQVLPAEEPLDVSHVRDEQPSVLSRRSANRDDATRQQRRPARSREEEQLDAAEDEGIKDEAPRRRASPPRSQAVPRRRPREDELEDADELDEDNFEDEAPRRRAQRSRTGAAPRRRARDAEDFDALDEDELDADDDEFDDDEEYLQDEPPLAQRRVEARAPRHRRGYDSDDEAPVRRSQRRPDERDELDGFDDEEIEDAPPPRRLTHRSHDLRARRPYRGPRTAMTATTRWTMSGRLAAFEVPDRPKPSTRSGIAKHAACGVNTPWKTSTRRCPFDASRRTRWNASSMMSRPTS
jgi:hypothetical protein